jgi:hypothetical protein
VSGSCSSEWCNVEVSKVNALFFNLFDKCYLGVCYRIISIHCLHVWMSSKCHVEMFPSETTRPNVDDFLWSLFHDNHYIFWSRNGMI